MNLVIRVHSNKDEAALQPIVAQFGEQGGTIGRSETNTLTLPDPNRNISRLQAEVACHGGAFSIRNIGSGNAVLLGGRPLSPGESAAIGPGDELVIGSYVLRVGAEGGLPDATVRGGARAAIDPRAVIIGSANESRTNPRLRGELQSVAASPPAVPPASPTPALAPAANPFADLFGSVTPGADPFADLLGAATPAAGGGGVLPPPAPNPPPPPRPAARPAVRLPDDFDPFADLPQRGATQPAPASTLPGDFSDLLGASVAPASLDRAFGLSPPGQADPMADFLAAPVDTGGAQPLGTDPLVLFGAAAAPDDRASQPAACDHVPELQAAYAPPAVHGAPAPSPTAAAVPAAPRALTPHPSPAAGQDLLWRAFCEGAGIAADGSRRLDDQTMRQLGQVLHAAVDGTIKLLAARATVKQELRADVTLIQSRDNNPLKFSPDAAAALEQLLHAPLRGFMPGPAAMHDAMADLLGHAMGTMAGMRAALHGVLQRFEPAQLERELGAHKMLDAVLPMKRRAKLWEQYLLHFERIRHEAHEDFDELFGKAFVEAYEEQLGKLKADRQ